MAGMECSLDRWFGTFHDGTDEVQKKMKRGFSLAQLRRRLRKATREIVDR
jgi:sterol desaturase/sphingolipid hydroxylase (fatty acid hydroxylase superfamily)